jgi:hypothetical protein
MAYTQCVGIKEEGRWQNLNNSADPAYIDVKMRGGCGDQGEDVRVYYTMRVWVRQSGGQYYGRPTVNAFFRSWNGQKWVRADISTGGYVDQMWVRAETRNMRPQLHVFIKHKSLDLKPSSQSEYWFIKK